MTGLEFKSKLKQLDVEFTQIADKLGITRQSLNSKLNTKNVDLAFIERVAKIVNKSVYYFINGAQDHDEIKKIPLVDAEAVAGFGNTKFSITEQDITGKYVIPDFTNIDFMMRVTGDSMFGVYKSGDIIACRILNNPGFIQWGKSHVLATKNQGLIVKRLRPSDTHNCYKAVSDNTSYDPFDIPFDEITGIALVVGVVRLE